MMDNNASVQPLVSILIRSMDRPTLQRALDSAAAQTWPNLEIVVVAACGKAHRALPETYRGRPLRLIFPDPDRKLPRPDAANLALESARGEWLNFLDDDDELLPQHLTMLMTAPRAHNERLVYARTRVVDEHKKQTGHCNFPGYHAQFFYQNRLTTCATSLHRSLIEEGVRFDPDFEVYEDHDFFIACAARTAFRFVDAVTSVWHAHRGESGAGMGGNDDPARHQRQLIQLRRKWHAQFEIWWSDIEALVFTGQHYLKHNNFAIALECLERALRLRSNDINAVNLCAMANLRAGNLERAQVLLTQALRQLPDHTGLRSNLDLLRRALAERAAQGERGHAHDETAPEPAPDQST